jgi:hypothetical protein
LIALGGREPEPRVLRNTRQHPGDEEGLDGRSSDSEATARQLVDGATRIGPRAEFEAEREHPLQERSIGDLAAEVHNPPRRTRVGIVEVDIKEGFRPVRERINESAYPTFRQGSDEFVGLQRFVGQIYSPAV